jgi:fumarate hydratase class II
MTVSFPIYSLCIISPLATHSLIFFSLLSSPADTMGEVAVPLDKYWGAQTQRSFENFKIGTGHWYAGQQMPMELIYAFAQLKKAAALTNCEISTLPREKADVICTVCDEILAGKHDDQFPLVIWQTGSGTQSNMNVNEVISNRATELLGGDFRTTKLVSANDEVNKSQSSNDTFPTAMHIALYSKVVHHLLPKVQHLHDCLDSKAKLFEGVVKIGRTHLMDATPITLGQVSHSINHKCQLISQLVDNLPSFNCVL